MEEKTSSQRNTNNACDTNVDLHGMKNCAKSNAKKEEINIASREYCYIVIGFSQQNRTQVSIALRQFKSQSVGWS